MISLTTELLPHQQAAVDKLLPVKVGALFMDMGTGKSRTAIELAERRQGKIDKVIWFTLVSLKETVRHEILKHTTAKVDDVYLFDDKTTANNLPAALWYVIGLESLGSSDRVLAAVNRAVTSLTMIIVDESSYIKGHRAKRTERVISLGLQARYRLLLTGTPISQGIQDIFSQMYFLSPKILGYNSWYSFSRSHLEYSDRYKGLIVRTHNEAWLAAKISPYVYQVSKEECVELPGKGYTSHYCSLTDEQWEYYERAKEEFATEVLENEDYGYFESSIPIFRLFSRLQAICCGFWNSNGEVSPIDNNRIPLLLDIIDQIRSDEKIVIWSKYRFAITDIINHLTNSHDRHEVCQYHGGLNEKKRHQELQRWRKSGRFLVATQAAGGHGIDLTDAATVIFYGNGFKYSERIQAEDRCNRIGQTRLVSYFDIWANCGIEERISSALAKKSDVVSEFKKEVDIIKSEGQYEKIKQLVESL